MAKNSITSRIRITRTGKLIRRKMGLSHFRAKKSSKILGRKYNPAFFAKADKKMLVKKYGLTP